MSLREVLLSGAADWGLELAPQSLERFEAYYAFLSEANQVMDLTAVMGEEETARRHFLDSLSLLRFWDFRNARVVDVGSGAGFPGLPLLLAEPTVTLTLLDAQGKRVDFLASLCEKLGVSVRCVHARAEEAALEPGERDAYDCAVSRAVARLNMLTELCLPFVKPGGAFLAMKARDCDEELAEAESAIRRLGGKRERLERFNVAEVERTLVVVRKTGPTPKGYPRRFAKIKKEPL
jgi:16S rRNA (guanine527-N7)-methyltransferase